MMNFLSNLKNLNCFQKATDKFKHLEMKEKSPWNPFLNQNLFVRECYETLWSLINQPHPKVVKEFQEDVSIKSSPPDLVASKFAIFGNSGKSQSNFNPREYPAWASWPSDRFIYFERSRQIILLLLLDVAPRETAYPIRLLVFVELKFGLLTWNLIDQYVCIALRDKSIRFRHSIARRTATMWTRATRPKWFSLFAALTRRNLR